MGNGLDGRGLWAGLEEVFLIALNEMGRMWAAEFSG